MSLKLSQNTINIGIVDLEGCFSLIEKGLANEGSFQISPKLEFRPDKGSPFFKPRFIQQARPALKSSSTSKTSAETNDDDKDKEENEEPEVVLTVFIIGFNPQFTEYDIYSINTWKKQNPDKPFVTLIMNKPQTTWVAITSSRSKIEKKFNKRIPDAKCIVIKYNTNEPIKENYISNSDFQFLHTSLETALSSIFEDRINILLHTKLNNENYISVYSELAGLLLSLGYNSASFTFSSKIKEANYKVFWPEKPEFYNIQENVIEKYDSGFDILCSGISQSFAAAKKSPYLYNKFAEELSIAFARILSNTSNGDSDTSKEKVIITTKNGNDEAVKTDGEKCADQEAIFFFDDDVDPRRRFMTTFARNFIHFTASSFCDIVETVNEPICATFSLISLSQTIYIFKLHNNKSQNKQESEVKSESKDDSKDEFNYNEEDFLSNLPPERRNPSNCEQLLLSSWGRARKVYTEWPCHQKYFDSIFFNYLTAKDDKEGALRVFNESDSLKIKNDEFFNYFESHVLLQLFEWKKSDKNLAVNIVSSKVPRAVKFEAIKLLDTIYPIFPVNAKFRCPQLFKPLELFETATFRIQFKVLDFLISTKSQDDDDNDNDDPNNFEAPVDIFVIFETPNGEKKLKSKPIRTVFYDENYILNSSIECTSSGSFSKMTLCMKYENTTLCWKLPMMQPLIVNEYSCTPDIIVKSPFLLSQHGNEIQTTVVIIENLDTECVELGVKFTLNSKNKKNSEQNDRSEEEDNDIGIYKIECEGQTFTGQDMFNELVFKQVNTKMKFFVHMKFCLFDGITVQCRHVRKDLDQKIITSSFEFPPHRELLIMLYQQNEKYQQFQIVNNFPVEFTFKLNNGKDDEEDDNESSNLHRILPKSKFFLLREKSEEPLILNVKEHEWEDFPLKIVTSSFHTKNEACQLKFDQSKWEVGIPRLIEVEPNAFPIIEADDANWIISSDLIGANHIFVPRSPGIHQFPQFVINNQATDCMPEKIEIFPSDSPTYVPM